MKHLIQTCQKLGRLLQSQSRALRAGDAQKLEAIGYQIEQSLQSLEQQRSDFRRHLPAVSQPRRLEVKAALEALYGQVENSQKLWTRHRQRLAEAREELRSSRRFAHLVRPRPGSGRHLFNRSA